MQGAQLAEDRLRGWARLMGLLVERPQLDALTRSPDWLPDDDEEIEFELLPLGSDKPAPWLIAAATEKDWQRITGELVKAMEKERACI